MKHEWRKQEKDIYLPRKIEITKIPAFNFLILEGEGNPNRTEFSQQIEALYSVSYAIRIKLKKGIGCKAFEYTVYPLEGVWTTSDGSRDDSLNKEALVYRIMIRQPESVTKEMVLESIENTKVKKSNPYLDDLIFETYEEGLVSQIIHTGSFDTEQMSFEKMDMFLKEAGYSKNWTMKSYAHREIYLSDARRVAPEKRKTVLRYKLKELNES